MCAARGILSRISMGFIFTHGTHHETATTALLSTSIVCKWRYSFIQSFGIIQIFCAQSNQPALSSKTKKANDDGYSTNRLQFSAFTHSPLAHTRYQNGHMVNFVAALMQSDPMFAMDWIQFQYCKTSTPAISPYKRK